MTPKLIIHGGAGDDPEGKGNQAETRAILQQITRAVYSKLLEGASALEAVIYACQLLEDEPRFNAGTGSVLQSDGQIRMSASLMDGQRQSFSGVINVSRVKNPIHLAQFLQNSPDRVLSDYGALELARELNIPPYNPLTDQRLQEWVEERKSNFQRKMAEVILREKGTIGAVALDQEGRLCAGTSTGGRGFERIGRVSDSATPAGNYANSFAAVSCTGVGEDILDEGLAVKIVTRVTDGMTLQAALEKSFAEARSRHRDFGAIAIDHTGAIGWDKTCPVLFAAYHDGEQVGDTLS
ncbi:MAG: isoaspartyl peptidase/L-asparaginase [Pseudanabaenaceae cyanobacterium SKYGB_i_bin29]|nr:isoaspartyl peptidase/L-asparaginase [Pseudanabaenaceae cyanobacterium SKYG29]MDW8422366.1 isoaspartyl peptidase/L-asparaginase [Pseudanabaenaceae cyanobacterium SKYGB_i_bin29]